METVRNKVVKRRRSPKKGTLAKVGTEKSIVASAQMAHDQLVKNHYARRRLLVVPDEIQAANPDKKFVFLNMNELEKNGMWHPGGYEIYRCDKDPDEKVKKFQTSSDGYVHRNEMVMAWLPKEEYEMRQLEQQAARGKLKPEDIFMKGGSFGAFKPTISRTSEMKKFPTKSKNESEATA